MENLDAFRSDKAEVKALGPTVGGDGGRNMDPTTAVDADLDRIVLEGIPTVNLGRGVPDPTPFGSGNSPANRGAVRRVLRRISGGRYGNEKPTADKPESTQATRDPSETGRLERRFRNLASRLRKPSTREPEKPDQSTQPTPAPKRDVYGGDEAIIFDQAEQLQIHEEMADAGKWNDIHNGHYDWWAYPIDRGSAAYGEFYSIAGEPLGRLKQNQSFLDSVADEIKIQAEALGWSLYERKFVDDMDWDGGQDWRKAYPTRIWKMTRSAQILGLEDEFESLKLMQQSLSEAGINFNHKKYWSAPGTIEDVPPLDSSYERTYGPVFPSTDPYPRLFESSNYSTTARALPDDENVLLDSYDDYEIFSDPVLKAADELATLLGESVEDDDLSYPYLDIRRDDRLDISDLLSFAGTLLPASAGDGLGVDRSETAYALTDILDQHNFYEDDISTIQTLVEVLENPDLLDSDFTLDDPTASMARRRRGTLPAKKKKKLTKEDVELVLDYESGQMRMSEIAEKLGTNTMAVSVSYRDARTSMNENVYEALGFSTPTGIPDHLRPVPVAARRRAMLSVGESDSPSVRLTDLDKTLLEAFDSGMAIETIATALRTTPSEARRRLNIAHRKAGLVTPTERRDALKNLIADEISMMRRRGLTERKIKQLFDLTDNQYSSLVAMRREEVTDWFPKLTDDEFMVAEMYFTDLTPIDGIASVLATRQTGRAAPASFASRQKLAAKLLRSAVKKLEAGRTRFGDDNQSLTVNPKSDERTAARINEFLDSGNTIRSSDVVSERTGRLSRRISRRSSDDVTASMSSDSLRTVESLQNFGDKPLLLPGSDRSVSPKEKSGLHGSIVAGESENNLATFLNGPRVMNEEFGSYSPEKVSAFASAARRAGLGAYETEGHSIPKVQGPVFFELADRIAGRDIVDKAISTAYPTYDELMDIFAANAIGMAKLMATAETDDIQSVIGHIFGGRPLPGSERRLWTYDSRGDDSRSRVEVMGLNLLGLYDGSGKPSFMDLLLDATGISSIDRDAISKGLDYNPIDFSRISVDESSPFAPTARAVISNIQNFLNDWRDFASRWGRAVVETMSTDAGLSPDQIRSAIETHWRNAGLNISGGSGTVLNSALNLAHHATVSGYAPLIYLEGPESPEIPAHEFFHAYLGQGFTRHGEYASFRGPWEMYDSWGDIFYTGMNTNSNFWMNVINEQMKKLGKSEAERADAVRQEIVSRVAMILDRSSSDPRYEKLFGELLQGFGETELSKLRSYLPVAIDPWPSAGWNKDPKMPKSTIFLSVPGAMVPKWLWPFGNGSFAGVRRYIDPDTGATMEYDESTGTYSVNPNRR